MYLASVLMIALTRAFKFLSWGSSLYKWANWLPVSRSHWALQFLVSEYLWNEDFCVRDVLCISLANVLLIKLQRLTPVTMKARFFLGSKYLTVVSSVDGKVFSKRRARSGFLTRFLMSLMTFYHQVSYARSNLKAIVNVPQRQGSWKSCILHSVS